MDTSIQARLLPTSPCNEQLLRIITRHLYSRNSLLRVYYV